MTAAKPPAPTRNAADLDEIESVMARIVALQLEWLVHVAAAVVGLVFVPFVWIVQVACLAVYTFLNLTDGPADVEEPLE